MNVLSLFDGMSCGRIALDRAGIQVNKYYASELDKYAIKVSQANYPDIEHLGDVTKWREWDIDWNIDLLIGGSPCQGFSFAGKQLAFDDPRSALFFVYVDILNHIKSINPNVKFMLENVRMKKEFLAVITEKLGVEPIFINSALVSAQNRQRYYWCNWDVEQPEDKGILLKDIIEDAITEKDKSYCIDANYHKGASWEQYKAKSRRQLVRPCEPKVYDEKSLCHHAANATDIKGNESIKRVYAETGKAPTLTTMGGGHREPKVLCSAVNAASVVGRRLNDRGVRDDYNKEVPITQCLQVKHDSSKMHCITTVQKDNLVIKSVNDNKRVKVITENDRGYRPHRGDVKSTGISELGRIMKHNSTTDALTTSHQPKLALNDDIKNLQYRKLTPIECERLQTVPDNYTNHVSNTQRYKMLGNGWTVDVVTHILRGMK